MFAHTYRDESTRVSSIRLALAGVPALSLPETRSSVVLYQNDMPSVFSHAGH